MNRTRCTTVLCLGVFLSSVVLGQRIAQTETIFPLFVEIRAPTSSSPVFIDTDIIRMEYDVVNPNSVPVHVTFQKFSSDGQELRPFSGLQGSLDIPPNGIERVRSFASSGQLYQLGWIRFVSTQPVIVREEFVHSSYSTCPIHCGPQLPEFIKSRFTKFPSQGVRHGIIKVQSSPDTCTINCTDHITRNTVIAVAFPSSVPAAFVKGTFILRNEKGEFMDQRDVLIPAKTSLISSYDALFIKPTNPPIPPPIPEITGTLEYTFDVDVYLAAFQMTNGSSLARGTIEVVEEPIGGAIR